MANDRADFEPTVRNAAWWSGDSRKAANGRGNEAVLEKLGLKDIPDLSDVEAVQMGHVMQPVIGQLAQNKLGIELKDADYALTHPKETWMRSHFDFISSDGKTLVEAKNYNAAVRNKFDAEALIIPAADMAQLIHEAACHNVEQVVKRIERDEQRLNAGQGTPKELEQMQHELISLNARRSELEEIELEVMLRADGIKDRIKELSSKEADLAIKVSEAAVAKDAALAAIDSELKIAVAARAELFPQIDKALADLYEKVGAAKLHNGQCLGCNL